MFTAIHPMCLKGPRRRERMSATIAIAIRVQPERALNLVLPRFVSSTLSAQQDYDRAELGFARSTARKFKANAAAERGGCAAIDSATSFKSSSMNRTPNAALLLTNEPMPAMFRISATSIPSRVQKRLLEHAHQLWDIGAEPDLLRNCIHVAT